MPFDFISFRSKKWVHIYEHDGWEDVTFLEKGLSLTILPDRKISKEYFVFIGRVNLGHLHITSLIYACNVRKNCAIQPL